jgi:hypothetical protein
VAGVELVEFNVAGGDAGDGAAGGDGVLAAHAAEEVQRAAGILGEVADVLVVAGAFVDDAVQPALAGPGLDQREAGLSVVEGFEVAFEPHDELGLGDGAVGQVAFHERRVEAEVGGGEQADRAGALQVAVELEQVSRGQPGVVVRTPAFLYSAFVRRPQHRARGRHLRRGTGPCRPGLSTLPAFADVSGMSALPRHCADSAERGAAVKHEAHVVRPSSTCRDDAQPASDASKKSSSRRIARL